MDWTIENNRIYANAEDRTLLAELTYTTRDDGVHVVDHTFVSPSLRGQGVAGEMMQVAATEFRARGYKVSATCSYAHAWFKRHAKDYEDILASAFGEESTACKIDRQNDS